MKSLNKEIEDYGILLRNIPPVFTSLFFLTVVVMNILANKELFKNDYIALDCGTLISWFAFLAMDMVCRRFGPKAAMKISFFSILVNLCFCLVFYIVSLTPGHWGQFYESGETIIVDEALNNTFSLSWYVVMGSAIAMSVSSVINSAVNYLISLFVKSKGFKSFALRSYISTAVAQFADNILFVTIVCHVFFGWTWIQILMCATATTSIELVAEILFSPLGYRLCLEWEKKGIGKEYLSYVKKNSN